MKAYLSFTLVFFFLLILISFTQTSFYTHFLSYEKPLVIEKTYQIQMNAKQLLEPAVKQGIKEGIVLATAEAALEDRPPTAEEIKQAVSAVVFLKLNQLSSHSFDDDFEVRLWCGEIKDYELGEYSRSLRQGEVPKIPIEFCKEFIQVYTGGNISVKLSSPGIFSKNGILISTNSDKYDVAVFSYFPPEKVIG
ncbi:hypothetical protein KAW38_04760 [Candidatus Micrarchaeota archaeon]|nr:hypothetical protein [Candidatus Micrarchaeota archaeon]